MKMEPERFSSIQKERDNESLSQLLDYMENTTRENAVSEELEAIQEMVDVVKEDAEVTVAYMKGFERDQMFLEEGKELGRKLEQENTLRTGRIPRRTGQMSKKIGRKKRNGERMQPWKKSRN